VRDALKIRRYVQLHSLPTAEDAPFAQVRGARGLTDGVAQLWWDSLEDLASDTPEARAAVRCCWKTSASSSISRVPRSGWARKR
jgi:hypothetical protein